jgi:dTDP-4-dehydrorhamnose reductase
MAKILITGANGQLGSELKVVSKNYFGHDFIFTDLEELDITDPENTATFIKNTRPDWIINCASYNQVDKAEGDYDNAFMVNVSAVRNISGAIKDTTCRFIHFSSDYVFDGNSAIPYSEFSIPNPLSAYGRSKLEGEKAALTHYGTMVIRTSWLYSSFGNNFVKTIIRLARENKTLRVVSDQTGTPTYAADLAEAIMYIIAGVIRNQIAFNAGIYNYSNDGSCSWYEFALAIVEEGGIDCSVQPVSTKEYQSVAIRPSFSVLNKAKIRENYNLNITPWRESLKKCISLIKKSN